MNLCARPFSLSLLLPLVAACGGQAPSKTTADVTCPPGQTYDGQYCVVDQSVATKETEVAQPEPEKEPEVTEPAQVEEQPAAPVEEQPPVATPKSFATPVDVTMAAQAAPVIMYMASSHLPAGASQMGSPFAGQFAEGQILEKKVQLTLGKCYTVVAAGLPQVQEINLEFFLDGQDAVLIKDETQGNQAVLGSRDTCFKPTLSGSYIIRLSVERGQGVAAAQVFQK